MVRATAGSGALRMTSASYSATSTVGQRSPTGSASFCNSGGRTTAGFWSLLGHAHVPIVLAGKRNTGDPTGSVDLQWSGTAGSLVDFGVAQVGPPTQVSTGVSILLGL
jgi:hypothetical protein